MISIRKMRPDDLDFADALRASEDWNQTREDWQFLTASEGADGFVAEWNGTRAGVVTTMRYGEKLGWIGMALVHADFRRKGLGTALLEHAIAHLKAHSIACTKLDATPLGKQVYEKLGFREEWNLTRWIRSGIPFVKPQPNALSAAFEDARQMAIQMDARAIGTNRTSLISDLMKRGRFTVRSGGFGIIRAGSKAAYLGPIVAKTSEEAYKIIQKLLTVEATIWDIPDYNEDAKKWARAFQFQPQRTLTRMYLGENVRAEQPEILYAIAGPELG